jgi:large subunit ribosomal protein L25
MDKLQLSAQPREITGRKVKQIRAEGLVPIIVYGPTQESVSLQVGSRDFERTLHSGGISQLVELVVDGGTTHNVLVRELQRHPVNHSLMHADFYAVNMSEKQQVSVAIHGFGEAEGMMAGLMMLQALDQVEIEALPSDIPSHIEIDITSLTMEESITVADLPDISGVEYVTPEDEAVFMLIVTREEEEEEEEEEMELVGEGMAEPEVLSGAKPEEDEE